MSTRSPRPTGQCDIGIHGARTRSCGAGTEQIPLELPYPTLTQRASVPSSTTCASRGQLYDLETGTDYTVFRNYDPSIGRYVQSDPIGLVGGVNTYTYALDAPLTLADPTGLYGLKPGVPEPSPGLDALLTCIENCYGPFVVTSTSEPIPEHPPGEPHRDGTAADIRYPSDPTAFLCCAKKCGAGFGLDEKRHPSAHSTAPHIHIQIPPGTRGGHGDLPPPGTDCSCKK